MSDWVKHPPESARLCFLSRALSALCVRALTGVDIETAAAAITDEYVDGGIDAIHFDPQTDTLFLVQSKWSTNGSQSLGEVGANKFVAGVRDLLAAKLDRFGAKIKAKEAEILSILYSDRPIRLRLITAHTAPQSPPAHATKNISDLVDEINDSVPVAAYADYNQSGVYELITANTKPLDINLQVVLNDWGQIDKPYLAYYGRVSVASVLEWWNKYRNSLFTQNLRLFHTNSGVNDALQKTLLQEPENFWYFNNGITVICDRVVKNLAGAPLHRLGIFNCEGVSVVNGAQTVGTIGSALDLSTLDEASVADSFVQLRIISLEKCPPEFGRRITRAANLQNAVGAREFAAMDPLQHHLATEFALDRRKYVYRSGEQEPRGDEGCSIVEVTQALASERSIALAVLVKREISTIWADTDASPYKDIFNSKLSSVRVWRAVRVMRTVDEELQVLRNSAAVRAYLIATHMNRIILHLVFQDPEVRRGLAPDMAEDVMVQTVRQATRPIFDKVSTYLEANHSGDYLAGLCKNTGKCETLAANYERPADPAPGGQLDFFGPRVREV